LNNEIDEVFSKLGRNRSLLQTADDKAARVFPSASRPAPTERAAVETSMSLGQRIIFGVLLPVGGCYLPYWLYLVIATVPWADTLGFVAATGIFGVILLLYYLVAYGIAHLALLTLAFTASLAVAVVPSWQRQRTCFIAGMLAAILIISISPLLQECLMDFCRRQVFSHAEEARSAETKLGEEKLPCGNFQRAIYSNTARTDSATALCGFWKRLGSTRLVAHERSLTEERKKSCQVPFKEEEEEKGSGPFCRESVSKRDLTRSCPPLLPHFFCLFSSPSFFRMFAARNRFSLLDADACCIVRRRTSQGPTRARPPRLTGCMQTGHRECATRAKYLEE